MLDLVDSLDFEGSALTIDHINVVIRQVSQAIDHLDTMGLDHGDLHARNVLVFDFDLHCPSVTHVKLGDFGSTKVGCASPWDLACLEDEMHALLPLPALN